MGKEKKIAKAEKDIRDYYEKLSISIGDKEKSAEYLNEILDIAIKFDTQDRYKISNLVKEWGYQRIEVMKKIKSDCTLSDGTFIPDLEYFYCASCHSRFYDDAAMTRIEKQKKSLTIEVV